MKYRGLLKEHFCKKNPKIPSETEQIVISTYSIKSLLSYYVTVFKNTIYVEANVSIMNTTYQLYLFMWFPRLFNIST